jgi:PilZ domain-containing protein
MSQEAPPRRPNRRLQARHACRLTVRYRTTKDWRPATAMDLSGEGCRLRLGEDLSTGSQLTVLLERLVSDGVSAVTVEVPGIVMWSRLEGLSHQAGIQFRGRPEGLDDILSALD